MTQDNLPQSVTNPKSSSRRILMAVILTVLVCVTLVSVYMPRMILWYFEPPMPMGVSCSGSIRWAIEKLQRAQLIAIPVGIFLGFLLGLKLRPKK